MRPPKPDGQPLTVDEPLPAAPQCLGSHAIEAKLGAEGTGLDHRPFHSVAATARPVTSPRLCGVGEASSHICGNVQLNNSFLHLSQTK